MIEKIRAARYNIQPEKKGWLFDNNPLPPLPAQHPLLAELTATKAASLQTLRHSILVILRSAYPNEWEKIRLQVDALPDGPEKSQWRAVMDTPQ